VGAHQENEPVVERRIEAEVEDVCNRRVGRRARVDEVVTDLARGPERETDRDCNPRRPIGGEPRRPERAHRDGDQDEGVVEPAVGKVVDGCAAGAELHVQHEEREPGERRGFEHAN
jgi:hypothetical protein